MKEYNSIRGDKKFQSLTPTPPATLIDIMQIFAAHKTFRFFFNQQYIYIGGEGNKKITYCMNLHEFTALSFNENVFKYLI